MVVSSRGGVAADTTATSAPLTKPSQPTRLVALRSPGGSLGGKIAQIGCSGLDIGWLLCCQL
jgi:hypothetical protein